MSIDVSLAAMRSHAGKVEHLKGRADSAVQAADSVSFHPNTFGKIGAALVYPLIAPLEVAGVGATRAASDSLSATATGMRSAADLFELVDEKVAELNEAIHKALS
ncbi:type VII secretion target [Nocardioides sp. zg-1228]|uniref:type VII secretion target n=1 Tax=Nocardioides sp. zg-1228 TaxID=2763008 RepID=UPI0016426589|nr:type VII secretion target [Nocardioides sp. zg-1228]MBC2932207.1 hypothetical protein [Nocardioides sp. zg-1228]QSF57739.1 hypothetical protein JX575_00375 [Nocardioides sp. zg-1228]